MKEDLYLQLDKCIKCGSCMIHCPIIKFTSLDKFPGPRFVSAEITRPLHQIESTRDVIYFCTTCNKCMEVCPQSVPTPQAAIMVRSLTFKPKESPKGHRRMFRNIKLYGRSVEPYPKDKKKVMLSRIKIPVIPQPTLKRAEVLYFPGCISEERLPEIKEAANLILNKVKADYTMPEKWKCCGSPVNKAGNSELVEELASSALKEFTDSEARLVVTECAGCASHLMDITTERDFKTPVLHLVEYLHENVGVKRLLNLRLKAKQKTKVTLHYPCHLYRGFGPYLMDYTKDILASIPNIELVEMKDPDRCCGAGGGVLSGAPEIAKELRIGKVEDILKVNPDLVVTPCPFCALNIKTGVQEWGANIPVKDFALFLAELMTT